VTAVARPALEATAPRNAVGSPSRLRIAFVYDALYPYVIGGAERRFHELGTRLAQRHEVHFVSWQYWDGPSRIERDGIIYHGVGRAPELYGADGKRTVREAVAFAARSLPTLLRNRWDVIDCSATPYLPVFSTSLAARLAGTPMVATWHEYWGEHWGEYLPDRPIVAKVARWLEARAAGVGDRVVSVSGFTARRMRARDAEVVPNGLAMERIAGAQPADELSDLLYAGRLIDEKRVDLLIDAVSRLTGRFPDLRCTIVGDGPERARLEARAVERGVAANVRLLGWVERPESVYGLMKRARLLVMPSVREGFGTTVVEGQACGAVPIVVRSETSAATELVRDGIDGLICDPSAEALADAIASLVGDELRRSTMADACRGRAAEWSWDRFAADMEAVYATLAARRQAAEVVA